MSQIWDIDAGFLDDELLTEQMRLLSGLINDQANREKRLPSHWVGHEDALIIRVNQLMAEMRLRDIATPEYQAVYEGTVIWPARYPFSLQDQLQTLAKRKEKGICGRIGLPSNERELWAIYRYSVMARNNNTFLVLGQQIASRNITFDDLLVEVVHASRAQPNPPDMKNALQQMWGYVSAFSCVRPNEVGNIELLKDAQLLARQNNAEYLLKSTALGELGCWC